MNLALLFPGQGSQRVGMGAELREARPDLFEEFMGRADAVSGLPIRRLCAEGPLEELTDTAVAQPAIFALSAAVLRLVEEAGFHAEAVAGHSLGEYTAAMAAGAFSWQQGLELVCLRGRLMRDVQAERPGAMAAITGLDLERLTQLAKEASSVGVVVVANRNSPLQNVVSGESDAVDRLIELARAAGAEQAVRLRVGAAFHSPLMEPVQEKMAEALRAAEWAEPSVPVALNHSGQLARTASEVRYGLVEQVTSSVRWTDCMDALIGQGATTFLEVGPGRVLTGLARLARPDIDASAADGPKRLSAFLAAHPGGG